MINKWNNGTRLDQDSFAATNTAAVAISIGIVCLPINLSMSLLKSLLRSIRAGQFCLFMVKNGWMDDNLH